MKNTRLAATALSLTCIFGISNSVRSETIPHSGTLHIFSGPAAQGACAILADRRLSCWGFGGGIVETTLVNGHYVESVAVASHTICVLLDDKSVWCQGDNSRGELGNGTVGVPTTTFSAVTYAHIPFGDVVAISAGAFHFCALKTDTSLWCWGSNSSGQLGNFGVPDGSYWTTPIDVVVKLDDEGDNTRLTSVKSISAGVSSTCASLIAADGSYSAACWGNNSSGQLGNGDSGPGVHSISPTTVNIDGDPNHSLGIARFPGTIVAGEVSSCALIPNANPFSVACWGDNTDGATSTGDSGAPLPETVIFSDSSVLTGVSAIATGDRTTCGILADRTGACWGGNFYGEVGNHKLSFNDAFSPVPITLFDGKTLGSIEEIALGHFFSCALTSDRSVRCWGDNSKYQLAVGIGGPTAPTDIPVITPLDAPIFADFMGD